MTNETYQTSEKKNKTSIILFSIIALNITIYFFNLHSYLKYNFKKSNMIEIWRYLTSCFCSNSFLKLILNILVVILISIFNEKKNGSIIFFFDLILKNVFINCLSSFLYVLLICLEVLFGSVFSFFLNYQKNLEIEGFKFILVLELFLILSDKKSFSNNSYLKFSPGILFFILSIFLFLNLHFLSALILGLIIYFKILNFPSYFEKKDFVYSLEKKIISFSSFFYFKNEELLRSEIENNKNYYENNQNDNEKNSLNDISNFVSEGNFSDDDDFSNFVSDGNLDPEKENKINSENLENMKKNDKEKKNLEDLDKSVDYQDFVLKSENKDKDNKNLYEI